MLGGWQRMMKPTSNTADKWKAGSGWPEEEWKGGGSWKEEEGEAVIDCTACVLLERRMTRGGKAMWEEWRAGFAPRAAVRALCPPENAPASLQWAVHWSHWIFDWHNNQLPLLTPFATHPPHINTTMYPGLIEIQKQALTPQAQTVMGRRGVGSCGSLGSNKKQMLNHLTTPKLLACKSAGTWGTNSLWTPHEWVAWLLC